MATLTNEYVQSRIASQFGDKITEQVESYGMLTVTVHHEAYFDLIKWLKEDAEINCMFLTDLTAAHYPDRKEEELNVVVHLHNLPANFRIRVKTYIASAHPHLPSLTPLYKSANWMERESFDFFGVKFTGHPKLKTILNVDDMDYHPMLKQYPMEDQTREDKDNKYFGR